MSDHTQPIVVEDPGGLPEDQAKVLALIDSEFGDEDDAPGYKALAAQIEGIDPLTGEPLDRDAAEKALAEGAGDDPDEPAAAEPAKDATAEPAKAEAEPATEDGTPAEAGATESEPDPAGVATADGKHVIPFNVLKDARENAARLQQERDVLNARLAEIEQGRQQTAAEQQQQQAAQQAAEQAAEAQRQKDEALKANIAKIREEYGEEAAKPYEVLLEERAVARQAEIAMRSELDEVKMVLHQRAVTDAQREQETIQAAIDSIPSLSQWQSDYRAAKGGDSAKSALEFEQAMAIDDVLRERPEWHSRPHAERFAHVARMLGGDVPAPGAPGPSQTTGKQEPPAPSGAAAVAAVERALAAADQKAAPNTLSDLPSGTRMPQSDSDKLDNMSQMELTEHYAGLTEEQMSAHLSQLM